MMIYAGYQSRQLATAYVTVSGKLVVAFQKTSIWMETGQCIWYREQGEGKYDVSICNFEAKYWLDFKKNSLLDHLLLMKKVTWTMNGLMFPTEVERPKTKPVLSNRMKKLMGKTSVRILFFKNGLGHDGCEMAVGKETMRKVILYQRLEYKLHFKVLMAFEMCWFFSFKTSMSSKKLKY